MQSMAATVPRAVKEAARQGGFAPAPRTHLYKRRLPQRSPHAPRCRPRDRLHGRPHADGGRPGSAQQGYRSAHPGGDARLPRERFVPADRAALAYSDEDVPLGGGRYLIEPMVIARLVQMAAVREGERVLVVGAGTGYGAALLAACGADVVALEQDAALLAIARVVLPNFAPAVRLVEGQLAEGWKAGAPYDVVLVEGAVPEIPAALLPQLRGDGGRLVTVLKPGARVGQAVLCGSAGGGRLERQPGIRLRRFRFCRCCAPCPASSSDRPAGSRHASPWRSGASCGKWCDA